MGLPIKGLIYITKIAITTIAIKKIIPIFLVLRIRVRIVATTTKLNTSPNDVTVITMVSTLMLPCIDLKYVVIKLSKRTVICEATNAVSVTKMITNTINCIDLISIIQVGQIPDNGNNWSLQITCLYTIWTPDHQSTVGWEMQTESSSHGGLC